MVKITFIARLPPTQNYETGLLFLFNRLLIENCKSVDVYVCLQTCSCIFIL